MAVQRTEEEKAAILQHCLDLEKVGGDILGYLWSQDYITPRATWFNYQREWLGRKPYEYTDGKPLKTKGDRKVRITKEQQAEAVRVGLTGGNPKEYLDKIGCGNPDWVWAGIRKRLKEKDPETEAKLPKAFRTKPVMPRKVKPPKIQMVAQVADETVVVHASPDLAFNIMAVKTDVGSYSIDGDFFEFKSAKDKSDAICMKVEDFMALAKELPNVMKVLGVSA